MKICIDPGHGGSSSGAVGKYSYEKDINLDVSLKLRDVLSRMGIIIVMTRKDDSDVSLQERCDIANTEKCDYFISIHCNSFSDPNVSGTETYYYPGSGEGLAFATKVQYAAVGYNQGKNRGVKTANFYVLKNTVMIAVLLECAFISNSKEEDTLSSKEWQDGFTLNIGTAIAQYFGYDLVTGNGNSNPPNAGVKISIMQPKRATVYQMEKFVHDVNPSAPYIAEKYLQYGDIEGVKGDMAFAQAIHETNYFKFTGNVKPGQNNFAGIGATSPGQSGAYFNTVDDGIKAHIQHLKAYASVESLVANLIDPRFYLVERGVAPNWQDLDGRWAVPGTGYGDSIVDIWNRILQVE